MGLGAIFNRSPKGGEKERGYQGLSIMERVRETASLKTSATMPVEERLAHVRKYAPEIARHGVKVRQP